jgi:hypothetical protein
MSTSSTEPSPPPRLSKVTIVAHPQSGSQIGVVAKRTYRVARGRCVIADEQIPLVEEPVFSPDRAALLHDMDGVLNRTETDVVLAGSARPPRPGMPSFELRVKVGALDRKLVVFGDRRCQRDTAGRLRFTPPTPVEAVPLDWTSSYGGFDRIALERHGDPLIEFKNKAKEPYSPRFGRFAYPRNRAGKGYLIEPTDQALEACALPNLEEPLALLTPEGLAVGAPDKWPTAAIPAAVGWLSYANFPRTAMIGMPSPYDSVACPPERFFEVKVGAMGVHSIAPTTAFGKRFDLRAAQQSAVGMRVADIPIGAMVGVVNAHPQQPVWEFALPREMPVLALQLPGGKPIRLEPKIRTLYLQPDLDRVSVVWVGEHQEQTPVGPGKAALIKHAVDWRA